MMQEFTYEQIRTKALKQGVPDNKFHIGMWASYKGYIKTQKKHNQRVHTIYLSPQIYPIDLNDNSSNREVNK